MCNLILTYWGGPVVFVLLGNSWNFTIDLFKAARRMVWIDQPPKLVLNWNQIHCTLPAGCCLFYLLFFFTSLLTSKKLVFVTLICGIITISEMMGWDGSWRRSESLGCRWILIYLKAAVHAAKILTNSREHTKSERERGKEYEGSGWELCLWCNDMFLWFALDDLVCQEFAWIDCNFCGEVQICTWHKKNISISQFRCQRAWRLNRIIYIKNSIEMFNE